MSFYTGTQTEELYSLPAAVTNNTFTTQRVISAGTVLPRAIVPANFFAAVPSGVGRGLLVRASGTVANAATAATFANVLAWDPTGGTLGSTLGSTAALAPTASTTCPWELEAFITGQAVGSAGLTLQCNGAWRQSVVASGSFSTANQHCQFRNNITGLFAEAQAVIELWSTCSVSNAGATITVDQFQVFGLN